MNIPESVNILLIGGGAREHALALGLSNSPHIGTLYATDMGNPGIAQLAVPVDIPVIGKELYRLVQFCDRVDIGLVVIGLTALHYLYGPIDILWIKVVRRLSIGL